jgi:signal transduction histidine kinase
MEEPTTHEQMPESAEPFPHGDLVELPVVERGGAEEDEIDEKSSLKQYRSGTGVITALILILGLASSAAFLTVGISSAYEQQEANFENGAADMVKRIQSEFEQYVSAASLIHNRCRSRNFSRQDFRDLYEYLIDGGLQFKAVQFAPNVTRDERSVMEAEARAYYSKNYPQVNYRGFQGFESEIPSFLEPRSEQDFYFPIHYMEPLQGNEAAIDLDYYSHISRRRAVLSCLDTGKPALTDRLLLVKKPDSGSRCGSVDNDSYGVVLMHPGVSLDSHSDVWPRDFAAVVICIPNLLLRSLQDRATSTSIYIHDTSDSSGKSVFLGGVRKNDDEVIYLPEIELDELNGRRLVLQEHIFSADKEWTVTVIALPGTYEPRITFVILGTAITLLASICLAVWVCNSARNMSKFNAMKAEAESEKAESEKASLILENALQATKAERELNDFIAHEVRNPVAAAMAACSFVKTALYKPEPDEDSRLSMREDITIVENSLSFVNDLMRSMLDTHKAAQKQLKIKMAPTDLFHDVLEPASGMLYQRGSKVKVIVECPKDLHVVSDCLRLRQIILNLGRNSQKFVTKGFIRLCAEEVDGCVRLLVDDSGSGIPLEKRERMYSKFQESLDLLNQGTVRIFLSSLGLYIAQSISLSCSKFDSPRLVSTSPRALACIFAKI